MRDRPHQAGLLDDYLGRLTQALRAEVIADAESIQDLDVRIVDALTRFLPYRDEYLQLVDFVVRDEAANRFYDRIQRFFETLTNVRYQHEASRWHEGEVEVLTFVSWELFLCTAAVAIRNENFGVISTLTKPVFVSSRRSMPGALRSFSAVAGPCRVLQEVTQKRLGESYYSYPTQLLKERSEKAVVPFDALMEADVVLWFRAETAPNDSWFPRTAFYWEDISGLPQFIRAQSREFFERLGVALGVGDKRGLEQALAALPDQSFYKAGDFWGGRGAYAELLGLPEISSRP